MKNSAHSTDRFSLKNPFRTIDEKSVPIIIDLIRAKAFSRLKDVKFLGGIDYLSVRRPNGAWGRSRYTRFQHSIGVARLASFYCSIRGLGPTSARTLVAASLLHDVGHSPLSHTIEGKFSEWFGINHHKATEDVILGTSRYGDSISSVLEGNGVKPQDVVDLLSQKDDPFEGYISGPINFDTIEGICRSWAYSGNAGLAVSPEIVLRAAMSRANDHDQGIVDAFWELKDRAYRYIVRSPRGVLADKLCEAAIDMDRARIVPADFLSSEKSLLRKSPRLKRLLVDGVVDDALLERIGMKIEYVERRFYVDETVAFFSRNDRERYRQTKKRKEVSLPRMVELAIEGDEGRNGVYWDEGIFRAQAWRA